MVPLIDELSKMKKELESLQPEDRMGLAVGIGRAVGAIAMSAGGWQQFLTDTVTLEKFDKNTLASIFDYFKQQATRQLEFDIKILKENANIIIPRLPEPPTQLPRGAYS